MEIIREQGLLQKAIEFAVRKHDGALRKGSSIPYVTHVICTMYEYFDIFLGRMTLCSHAARFFNAQFSLNVNGQKVL